MTYQELAATITDIRYGKPGKIEFKCAGQDCTIKEPSDVLLVGYDDKLAALWIAKNYNFLLATL